MLEQAQGSYGQHRWHGIDLGEAWDRASNSSRCAASRRFVFCLRTSLARIFAGSPIQTSCPCALSICWKPPVCPCFACGGKAALRYNVPGLSN